MNSFWLPDVQKVIVFEGPDGSGKTEISRALSDKICVPYFKMRGRKSEQQNWKEDTFVGALRYGETQMAQYLEQTFANVIMDRAWPSEFAYHKVFTRDTDQETLKYVDETYAAIGTVVVLCVRHDYSKARPDDLVPNNKLQKLHDEYLNFRDSFTWCKTITLYVDSFNNSTTRQLDALVPALEQTLTGGVDYWKQVLG